ncbi:hypothetical protein [Legionella pneumophila]|uniref:Acetyl-CoA acetyltransferase n=1 Tax=Legionella pneumophila subsp. pascullei TaxID=91890 RepID=A0AAX2IZ94_LEGPN|nr:hypothetical protein [Legionella pneumophila]AMP90837.1 hypothetical protein AXF35_14500 [Legionella pneumophila subsp. pascullei]AMP93821.1 hypothetical protein AXF36_14865 [Legionella pneumophila subsp. pascullei]AMP96738.1 hypothetical protein AXF37_14500 [Legionella pneumophila subsp. pascullei]SQG91787.1 acetyl-CoA acetyltransferase [Legionella pneumophila subsp. pascullei]VEH08333.1 acetyl-CoA acetyltransferase [Legionella pneumophila subsp. pascullei]
MMKLFIIAADRIIDSVGSHQDTDNLINQIREKKFTVATLKILSLAKGWQDKIKPYEFTSGASAMAAIERARKILSTKKADVVLIKGQDFLKTGYGSNERVKFMKFYHENYTPIQGYDELVPLFLQKYKLDEKKYFKIRDALFENYTKTWKKINPANSMPHEKWYQSLTKYFRGVDCANPNVDFSGQLIVSTEKAADVLNIPQKARVEILGNSFVKINLKGVASLPKIATYHHLKRAINKAIIQAKFNFKDKFMNGDALLDAYTCYPIVPMALLYHLGLVNSLSEIPDLLKSYEVTVTGGLNLGKAPWSLTSLNALIVMRERLISSNKANFGLVHGNGLFGNQQGITILKK